MIRSFSLSFAAVDILSEALHVNCRQYPFQLPSVGTYLEDRARIAIAVFADLERRGLARGGNPRPETELALRLLGESELAIAVLGHVNGGRGIYARAAATAGDAVVIIQEDSSLRFDLVRREALVPAVVDLVPSARAGPGRSVTFTHPGSASVGTEPDDPSFRRVVRAPRGTSDTERRAAEEILRRPRLSTGYFVISKRAGQVPGLSWIHTDAGRHLAQSVTNEHGDLHVTYFPADDSRLVHTLTVLIS